MFALVIRTTRLLDRCAGEIGAGVFGLNIFFAQAFDSLHFRRELLNTVCEVVAVSHRHHGLVLAVRFNKAFQREDFYEGFRDRDVH